MDDLVFSDVVAGFVLLDERHRQKLSSFAKRSGRVGFPEVQDDPHELLARHAHLFLSATATSPVSAPALAPAPAPAPDGVANGGIASMCAPADELDDVDAENRRRALAYYDTVLAEASSTYRFLGLHMWPPFSDDKKLEQSAPFPPSPPHSHSLITATISLQPSSDHLNLLQPSVGDTFAGNSRAAPNNAQQSFYDSAQAVPFEVSSLGISPVAAARARITCEPESSEQHSIQPLSEPQPQHQPQLGASPIHLLGQRAPRSSPERPPEIVEFPEHRLAGKLWTDLGLLAHFLRLAYAIYGWPLFLVTQPFSNYMNLYTNLQYSYSSSSPSLSPSPSLRHTKILHS